MAGVAGIKLQQKAIADISGILAKFRAKKSVSTCVEQNFKFSFNIFGKFGYIKVCHIL